MIDIAMDPLSNDIIFSGSDLELVSDDAAIRQNLLQLLQFFLGEWFLDTTQGFPYYQIVLVKNPSLDLIQGTMIDYISNADGIVEVDDFAFDYDRTNRGLSISVDAKSTSGQILSVVAQPGV